MPTGYVERTRGAVERISDVLELQALWRYNHETKPANDAPSRERQLALEKRLWGEWRGPR